MARHDTIAFVDVETTGLDPTKSDPIEIAVVTVDAKTLEEIRRWDMKMFPGSGLRDPEALAVNGYTDDEWKDSYNAGHCAWSHQVLRAAVVTHIGSSTVAGHNPWFDVGFIKKHCPSDLMFDPAGHHLIDTCSMAFPLLIAGKIESLSLDSLCAYFDIKRPKIHRALPDALAELQVCRELTQMYMDGMP